MIKIIFILLFSFSLCSLNAQTKTYHTNGKLKEIGFYDEKKHKIGEWKYYWIKGNLHSIVNYKEGFKTDWKHYDNNGQLRESGKYIKGKKTGKWMYYNLEGDLSKEGTFKNGQKEGEWKGYYKDKLRYSKNYKNGKKEGEWKYYRDGKLHQIEHYNKGKGNGDFKKFFTNENLTYSYSQVNGSMVGERKDYYESGKIKKIQTFEDGETIAIKSFYENGFLSATKLLLKNKKIQAKSFYDNGRLGSVAYIANFRNWQPIGIHKHYHQNGKLHYKVKNNYTKRTKTKGYYANGKRKFKGYKIMVENDGNYTMKETGKWEFYKENGKLDKIEHWEAGKLINSKIKL